MDEVEAFAADCLVFGHADTGARRLTDVLNEANELALTNVRLESLADGHVVELPELTADGAELCAVVAAGHRGDAARRVRTHATRVQVDVGPYHVEGSVHGTPASDPLALALRRAPWIPLTGCTVAYSRGTNVAREEVETLLVNRDLVTSIRRIEEESVLLPWEQPRERPAVTSRAIDLTASLQDVPRPEPQEPAQPPGPEPVV